MTLALSLLLLVAAPAKSQVPEVAAFLTAGENDKAIALLREIAGHKDNHAEAADLVKLIRAAKPKKAPEIYQACFEALAGIGSRKVTGSVIKLLKHRTLKKDPAARAGVCKALGGSADPKAVGTLIERMRDTEDSVKAAAIEAAGKFRYARLSDRKELFEAVLGVYVPTWNMKESINPDHKKERQRAARRWELIAKPSESALQLLSNKTQEDPPAWRKWWNENKKKKWEELED